MPFKEGVNETRVRWVRQLVDLVRKLDQDIDRGEITPDKAFETLDKTMDSMTSKTPKKAEKYSGHAA